VRHHDTTSASRKMREDEERAEPIMRHEADVPPVLDESGGRAGRGVDGLSGDEGAFGICSFWAVEQVAQRGEVADAERLFDHLLSFSNDVGLFAEEIDSRSGEALGNFPQAFTHVGLINVALAIEKARRCQGKGRRPK